MPSYRKNLEVRRIIRSHYGLNRPVTPAEALAEIQSLERKHKAGSLDDKDEQLAARLSLI